MAFSSTTDTRTHVMGDLMMVTGTWNAASVDTGTIVTGLSEILAGNVIGDTEDNTGGGVDGAFAIVTTAAPGSLTIDCVSGNTGKWWALGKR
ncbi:hypothetical protein [uncultured Mediterranean phage]|nr:hypothetical protein [uncultured Mediterranean phage]